MGTYLFQQPVLLPGTATYFIADLPLADDGTGYIVTIDSDEPVVSVDVFSLPAAAAPTPAAHSSRAARLGQRRHSGR